MRFSIQRDQFVDLVTRVKAAVTGKSVVPVLQGLLITAEKGRVSFRGTDLETDIEASTSVEVQEPGKALVSGKVIIDLSRKLPQTAIEVSDSEGTLTLKMGKGKVELTKMDAKEFPQAPKVGSTEVQIPRAVLREIIKRTVPFVARDNGKPWLTGVHFKLRDGNLTAMATDGVRISAVSANIENTDLSFAVTISGKSLKDLANLLDGDGPVTFRFGEGQGQFDIQGDTKVAVRLLDGNYPDVLRLVPQSYEHQFTFETDEFLSALDRASTLAAKSGVRLILESSKGGPGYARMEANQAEIGTAQEQLTVVRAKGGLSIAFNEVYLNEGIRVLEDREFTLEMSGERNPARIQTAVVVGDVTLQHVYVVLPLITL